jgi:hypothetical protein
MKSFLFKSLSLLAPTERRGRTLSFSPSANAIIGGNHRGKSTVLRMLYYPLGCTTRRLGPQWTQDFTVLLTFAVGGVEYRALRSGTIFALFDADGTIVWAGTDQGEYRDVIAAILRFNLQLTPQQGPARLARISFFFLPTYIDQDGSWESGWSTFQNLGEFKDWQAPTIDFFLGVRPAKYWTTFAALSSAKNDSERVVADQAVLQRARARLEKNYPKKTWYRGGLHFRTELKMLEEQSARLAREEISLRDSAAEIASNGASIDAQVALVEAALKEHSKDMAYLGDRASDPAIICPTCGTSHENSFHERLNLESEADDLREVYKNLLGQRARLKRRFELSGKQLSDIQESAQEIKETLDIQRGAVKLRDIVDQAGITKAYEALEEEARALATQQGTLVLQIANLELELKAMQDPQKSQEVAEKFNSFYGRFAAQLDVPSPDKIRRGAMHRKPSLGGSGGPRAILAYHFALAHTARETSNNVLPPMVIDSPHAKAQDAINRPKVTEFIFGSRINDIQMIAAFEETLPEGLVLDGKSQIINLDRPYNLLLESEYGSVRSEVQPLLTYARKHIAEKDTVQQRLFEE